MTTDAVIIDRVGLAERERVLTLLRAREAELLEVDAGPDAD